MIPWSIYVPLGLHFVLSSCSNILPWLFLPLLPCLTTRAVLYMSFKVFMHVFPHLEAKVC